VLRVLIIGAGGHGQVAADILLAMRDAGEEIAPLGFLDANPNLAGTSVLGLPVLGHDEDLAATPHDAVLVALGENDRRRRVFEELSRAGERLALAVHPTAVLGRDVRLGPGCMVCARAVVNTGARVAENCILNTGCVVEHHCAVGAHAHIGPGAVLGGGCAVGAGALVGLGAAVLPLVRIGEWAVVGAGAVAPRDVPDKATVKGPAAR
jgi:sugar O-acyltransferase (sialic acid O-acetyltransferase NeuD family)